MKQFLLRDTLIYLDDNSFNSINKWMSLNHFDNKFIIADENTSIHCLPVLLKHVPLLKDSFIIKMSSGESAKSIAQVEAICSCLINKNIDRQSLIVNLGGGVVCDLGGFVASIIKRGVKFINIPTTLMSQIDAAIGGKVAVNFQDYKNQIGLFVDPQIVFVYTPFLLSLSHDDLLSAQAEIFKYGLIYDRLLWEQCRLESSNKIMNFKNMISDCIKIKIKIVESDYYDYQGRRMLNFGHSICHAIESVFLSTKKQPVSHGFALSVGLICETYISYKKFKFSSKKLSIIVNTILSVFPKINLVKALDNLVLKYLKSDKKNKNRLYNFTLIKDIGVAVVNCSVSDIHIINSLDYYRKKCQT
ncbi:MAG: 3-dehydroquinate synthase [Flavobacteriales bacterium]|nr:3-dehydroquinate synthase [Flavobacteriales bacterium]